MSKRLFRIFILMMICVRAGYAQTVTPAWTWVKGNDVISRNGIYGTQGSPAAANLPGSRYALGGHWKDVAGNVWIFGGLGYGASGLGALNDLWKYDTLTRNWTWMKGSTALYQPGVYGTQGVPAAANVPAGRNGGGYWQDAAGNFWLFGGQNLGGQFLNDLCRYTPSTNEWTWINGSAGVMNQPGVYGTLGMPAPGNRPGGRHGAMSWQDAAGNFWLFGGHGFDAAGASGELNDLWKYNPATNEWTWISGASTANPAAVYGTRGVAAPGNVPGGRGSSATWIDDAGNLWLFGGVNSSSNYHNDLWRYSPVTGQWTWMNGASTVNVSGTYGTLYTPAAGNTPGARYSTSYWKDTAGNFWLFGGYGYNTGATRIFLNDLWKYDMATNQWRWVTGVSTGAAYATYGTLGVAAPGNTPGGRQSAWGDWNGNNGNLWLFGGYGNVASGPDGYLNDTWRFSIACSINLGNDTTLCAGTQHVLDPGFPGMPRVWNTGDTTDVLTVATPGAYWCAMNMPCGWTRDTIVISFEPTPVVDLGPDIQACPGDVVILQSSPSHPVANNLWSTGAGTPDIQVSQSGQYWLQVRQNGCTASDTIMVDFSLQLTVDLGGDVNICDSDLPLTLTSVQPPNTRYLWSNGLSQTHMEVTRSGTYWLQVSNNDCRASDTIVVTVTEAPFVYAGADSVICESIPLQIGTTVPGATYQWSDGSTTPYIYAAASGHYILTVQVGPCIVRDTVSITAMPDPEVNLGPDTEICAGHTIVLQAGSPGATYLWYNGSTAAADTVSGPGAYWVTVTSAYHCVRSDTIQLTPYTLPVISLGRDTTVCEETPLILQPAYAVNVESLLWSDGSAGDRLSIHQGGTYYLHATNKCGTVSDTVYVRQVFCDIWLPNAFTPNGDGLNDILKVLGNTGRMQHFRLSIFNRWGQEVFGTHDPYSGWDGTQSGRPCELGTYVYMLEYSMEDKPVLQKGNVTLFR